MDKGNSKKLPTIQLHGKWNTNQIQSFQNEEYTPKMEWIDKIYIDVSKDVQMNRQKKN